MNNEAKFAIKYRINIELPNIKHNTVYYQTYIGYENVGNL